MILVELASQMMSLLDQINRDSFQEFSLRVGVSRGPVVAGRATQLAERRGGAQRAIGCGACPFDR